MLVVGLLLSLGPFLVILGKNTGLPLDVGRVCSRRRQARAASEEPTRANPCSPSSSAQDFVVVNEDSHVVSRRSAVGSWGGPAG